MTGHTEKDKLCLKKKKPKKKKKKCLISKIVSKNSYFCKDQRHIKSALN